MGTETNEPFVHSVMFISYHEWLQLSSKLTLKSECSSFTADFKATVIMIVKISVGFCTKILTNKQLLNESLGKNSFTFKAV